MKKYRNMKTFCKRLRFKLVKKLKIMFRGLMLLVTLTVKKLLESFYEKEL